MSASTYPDRPIIIVDDETQITMSYDTALRMRGMNHIVTCEDARKVRKLLDRHEPAVVLLDLMMPYRPGEEILEELVHDFPHVPVVVITGKDETETAVKCMKIGAFDFLVKPVERERLVTTVKQAIDYNELNSVNLELTRRLMRGHLEHPEHFTDIITNSPEMRSIFQYIEAVANTTNPILVTGETGSGKELLARALHKASGREGDFVKVNAAGLDDSAFNARLYGRAARIGEPEASGAIEAAQGGTLFLDEVGHLGNDSQLKILRLMQDGEYTMVGHDVARHSNARLVLATNRDLQAMRDSGEFRKDLFYRLRANWIQVPPLRDRMSDLPLLLDTFLEEAAGEMGKAKPRPPKELLTLLSNHSFPGNVRELQDMVQEAVREHKSMMLSMDAFKKHLYDGAVVRSRPASSFGDHEELRFGHRLPTMDEMKKLLIEEALRRTGGNKTLAATILGITRQAISWREKRERAQEEQAVGSNSPVEDEE